jgi:type IV pilus assembly protein PilB
LERIIAQRLVRKICPSCIYSYDADEHVLSIIKSQRSELGIPEDDEIALPKTLYRGKGCAVCGMTGYIGRVGIFEILEVTDAVKRTIDSDHFNIDALRAEARRGGMKTMFEDGLRKVELAETTIDEVLRVIRE